MNRVTQKVYELYVKNVALRNRHSDEQAYRMSSSEPGLWDHKEALRFIWDDLYGLDAVEMDSKHQLMLLLMLEQVDYDAIAQTWNSELLHMEECRQDLEWLEEDDTTVVRLGY